MEVVVYSLRDCLEIIKGMGIDVSNKSLVAERCNGIDGADIFGTDIVTISQVKTISVLHSLAGGTGIYKSVLKLVMR